MVLKFKLFYLLFSLNFFFFFFEKQFYFILLKNSITFLRMLPNIGKCDNFLKKVIFISHTHLHTLNTFAPIL